MRKTSMRIYALILSVICLLTSLGLPNLVNAQENEKQISVNLYARQNLDQLDKKTLSRGNSFYGVVGKTYTGQEILNEILGEKASYFKPENLREKFEIKNDTNNINLTVKQVKADLNIEFKTQSGTLAKKVTKTYTDMEKLTDYENLLDEEELIKEQSELNGYKLKNSRYSDELRTRDIFNIPNLKAPKIEIRVGKVSAKPQGDELISIPDAKLKELLIEKLKNVDGIYERNRQLKELSKNDIMNLTNLGITNFTEAKNSVNSLVGLEEAENLEELVFSTANSFAYENGDETGWNTENRRNYDLNNIPSKNMRILKMISTNIDNINNLDKYNKLEELAISNTNLESFKAFGNLKNLKKLNLQHNINLKSQDLELYPTLLSNVEELDLSNTGLSDVKEVARQLDPAKITKINLRLNNIADFSPLDKVKGATIDTLWQKINVNPETDKQGNPINKFKLELKSINGLKITLNDGRLIEKNGYYYFTQTQNNDYKVTQGDWEVTFRAANVKMLADTKPALDLTKNEVEQGEIKGIKDIIKPDDEVKDIKVNKDIDPNKPGKQTAEINVEFIGGSKRDEEVTVTVKGKPQAETFIPQLDVTPVQKGNKVELKDRILNLPADVKKTEEIQPVNTAVVGNRVGKIKITFADDSEKTVEIPVTVLEKQPELGNGLLLRAENTAGKTVMKNTDGEEVTLNLAKPVENFDVFEVKVEAGNPTLQQIIKHTDTVNFPILKAKVVDGKLEVEDKFGNKDTYNLTPATQKFKQNPETEEMVVQLKLKGKDVEVISTLPLGTQLAGKLTTQQTPKQAELFTPELLNTPVNKGDKVALKDRITNLPQGVVVQELVPVDTNTAGDKVGKAKVTFPDGSSKEVNIPVKVVEAQPKQSETFTPDLDKTPVNKGDKVNLADRIKNLPQGAEVETLKPIDTDKVGEQTGKVRVTFPDKSTKELDIPVTVVDTQPKQADTFKPEIDKTPVKKGEPVDLKDRIKNLPQGAEVETIKPVDTNKVGEQVGKVEITFQDGSKKQFEIPVTVVGTQADNFTPVVDQTPVNKGDKVNLKDRIKNLPQGATVKEIKPIDTDKLGKQVGQAEITFPDGSKKIVDIPVNVVDKTKAKTQAETYRPELTDKKVYKNDKVDTKDLIKPNKNIKKITVDKALDTSKVGKNPFTVTIEFKDGSKVTYNLVKEVLEKQSTGYGYPWIWSSNSNKTSTTSSKGTTKPAKETKNEKLPKYWKEGIKGYWLFTIGEKKYTYYTAADFYEYDSDIAPYIKNERTYLPLRYVGYTLQLRVDYNDAIRTSTFSNKNQEVKVNIDTKQVTQNGKPINLETPIELKNERLTAPVSQIGKLFDKTVSLATDKKDTDIIWLNSTRQVIIYNK